MKAVKIVSVISLFFLPCSFTYAQSPESFFPHNVGDTWQYTLDNTNTIYDTDIIVADSTDSIGGHYLRYEGNSGYRFYVDTSYNVYTLNSGYHYYKLDADSGDSWIFWFDTEDYYIQAIVISISEDIFWDIPTKVKEIEYWLITSLDSLWLATRFLASDFGLVAFWGEPGPFYHLSGAIIDSVQYGFIVGIDERQSRPILPNVIELYQNYPNPFNPYTTIQYELTHAMPVALEVFNSLGQKIITLINEFQPPGNYRIRFDGSNVPSGVYYYRLKAGRLNQQKKMLLIK